MEHRSQVVNFRTSEFPLSGSFASFLLKSQYTSMNIGELFEYLTDILFHHTTGVLTNRVDFSLVNVFCPFNRFSYGKLPPPPKTTWPTGKCLVFTFSTSAHDPYDRYSTVRRDTVRHLSNMHTRWSHHPESLDYVSISIDMTLGNEYGIHSPKFNELRYIYNLIGGMTKSVIRRQTAYRDLNDSYEDMHASYSLIDLHSRISSMPIKNLFTQIPYHLWVFNRHLWQLAPNIIPQRLITPQAAMYYFMYLNGVVRKQPRTNGDVTMHRLGLLPNRSEGILELLRKSVLSFVQMIKTPGDVQLSDLELLAPAVIQALMLDGNATIDSSSNYRQMLIGSTRMLIEDLQARENDLGYMFLPPEETARKLMLEDLDYIDMLESAMAFPQTDLTFNSDQ